MSNGKPLWQRRWRPGSYECPFVEDPEPPNFGRITSVQLVDDACVKLVSLCIKRWIEFEFRRRPRK
jgi:hypothetical protein